MNVVVTNILKSLASDLLLFVLEWAADELKSRDDNTMYHDADEIKRLVKRNKVDAQ